MGQLSRYRALTTWCLILLVLVAPPAVALEPLFFKPEQDAGHSEKIAAHISLPPAAFMVALTDLNNDGKEEIIARTVDCPQSFCWFHVLAFAGDNLTTLAYIQARTILPADSLTAGIRDLSVFASTENDFAHENYVWTPPLSRYTRKSGEE